MKKLLVLLLLTVAVPALAILPVDGNLYRVRFTAGANTDEVCIFRFAEQANKANALKCMGPVATDGNVNEIEVLLEPTPTADQEIIGLAYRHLGPAGPEGDLISDVSNVQVLQVRPPAIHILP